MKQRPPRTQDKIITISFIFHLNFLFLIMSLITERLITLDKINKEELKIEWILNLFAFLESSKTSTSFSKFVT